jgi:hypothetical protein
MVKVVVAGTSLYIRPDKCVQLQDISLGHYKAVVEIN